MTPEEHADAMLNRYEEAMGEDANADWYANWKVLRELVAGEIRKAEARAGDPKGGEMSGKQEIEVFKTRWGYVAYGYDEYLKLRRLHAIYFMALRLAAQWERWARKAPHNRVRRRALRDLIGRKMGHEIVGPSPEPSVCGLFSRKLVTVDRKPVGRWFEGWIKTADRGVVGEYRKARRPVASPEGVGPRGLSGREIDALLAEAEGWLASA